MLLSFGRIYYRLGTWNALNGVKMDQSNKTFEVWRDGVEVEETYQTFVVRGWWIKHGSKHNRSFMMGDSLPAFQDPKEIRIDLWGGEVDAETRARLLTIIHESRNLTKVILSCILTPEQGAGLIDFAEGRINLETSSHSNGGNTTNRHIAFRSIVDNWKYWAARGHIECQVRLENRRLRMAQESRQRRRARLAALRTLRLR